MSDAATPIMLAHEAPFALGRLTVRPPTREVARDDGVIEVLEPRVMQVLVALHRAGGGIVARDDLTQSCWEGRVVGEDAINRVISRLRRTAGGIGESAFRVETVTKVGYRLVGGGAAALAADGDDTANDHGHSRRLLLVGAGFGVAALAGGGAWLAWRSRTPQGPPASVAALMTQAGNALFQDTREGQNQAIGLYQEVVETEPGYADGWGLLSFAYALAAHFRPTAEAAAMRQRALAAGARSLALDASNGYGRVGLATAGPRQRAWLETERAVRRALADHPENILLLLALSGTLASVGRAREASDASERIGRLVVPNPDIVFTRIWQLWGAGRQEEADQLMAQGARLFPTHFAVWFARFYVNLYSGRPGAALAMAADRGSWPSGIPEEEVVAVARVAAAAQSREPAAIDAIVVEQRARARRGTGLAENAIHFTAFLDRIDDAYAIADAYYFNRGWTVPDVRFSAGQGTYLPHGDRLTAMIFSPSTAAMRSDTRFAGLVRELGLEDYWRRSGTQPDYRRRA